jgi:hypothetical protein
MRGEVVGINTQKLVKKNVNGIGFALSASDLIEVLQRFYPNSVPATEKLSTPTSENPVKPATPFEESLGTVTFSGLQGAQIEIDGLFVGEIPGTYNLTVGSHNIVVRAAGRTDWIHVLTVFKDSRTTLTIFQDSPR